MNQVGFIVKNLVFVSVIVCYLLFLSTLRLFEDAVVRSLRSCSCIDGLLIEEDNIIVTTCIE